MIRKGTVNFRRSAAQFLLGNIALGHPWISIGFAPPASMAPHQPGRARRMIKSDLRQQRPKALRIYYYAMAVLSVAVAIVLTEIAARLLQTEPVASLML